jgi:DNA repair protein RadC
MKASVERLSVSPYSKQHSCFHHILHSFIYKNQNIMSHTIHEVQIQYTRPILTDMKQVIKSNEAEPIFRAFLDTKRIDYKEFFLVMLLTSASHVLGIAEISVGSSVGAGVNLREVFQLALKANATAVILCHNHPSGRLTPSSQDISLTASMYSFGKMIGINIVDHLIITSEGYYSMADNGQV